MSIDTTFFEHCLDGLECALHGLKQATGKDNADAGIYYSACLSWFEKVMDQSGKLLRKHLGAYFASNLQADRLTYKGLFRHAAKHGLLDIETVERWLHYRDHRNDMDHDYDENFSKATQKLLPDLIADARTLVRVVKEASND